jgi:hypothetical protein
MTVERTQAHNIPGPPARLGGYLNLMRVIRDPIRVMGQLFHAYGPVVSLANGARPRLFSSYPRTQGLDA